MKWNHIVHIFTVLLEVKYNKYLYIILYLSDVSITNYLEIKMLRKMSKNKQDIWEDVC